jgi:hypothetical protein
LETTGMLDRVGVKVLEGAMGMIESVHVRMLKVG